MGKLIHASLTAVNTKALWLRQLLPQPLAALGSTRHANVARRAYCVALLQYA